MRYLGSGMATIAVLLGFALPATAGNKTPKAKEALKRAAKAFAKIKSYDVRCQVRGGLSTSVDHKLDSTTVSRDYEARTYRGVMEVASPMAYRRGAAGAIYDSEKKVFKALMGNAAGTELQRLFPTPEELLFEASRFGKKVRWIVEPRKAETAVAKPEEQREGTRERETGEASLEAGKVQNGIIAVALPAKVSLKRFVKVQNSGCLGGG